MEGTRSYGIGSPGSSTSTASWWSRSITRAGRPDTAASPTPSAPSAPPAKHLPESIRAILGNDGDRKGLRVLLVARQGAIASCAAAINSRKALLLPAPDSLPDQVRGKPAIAKAAWCARLCHRPRPNPCEHAHMLALRATARRCSP